MQREISDFVRTGTRKPRRDLPGLILRAGAPPGGGFRAHDSRLRNRTSRSKPLAARVRAFVRIRAEQTTAIVFLRALFFPVPPPLLLLLLFFFAFASSQKHFFTLLRLRKSATSRFCVLHAKTRESVQGRVAAAAQNLGGVALEAGIVHRHFLYAAQRTRHGAPGSSHPGGRDGTVTDRAENELALPLLQDIQAISHGACERIVS